MRLRDMGLAALTSIVWGLAFIATKFGLDSFSAPELTALRFLIASLAVILAPRPRVSWSLILCIGMTLFTGQFLLLFYAFAAGMPPGLASVTQQMHVFFTVLLTAIFLRDIPTLRQCAGMSVAFAGLALIGLTVGSDVALTGLGLALAGAMSWAIGNLLVKRAAGTPIFPLIVWCSLVPPLPALLVSSLVDRVPLLDALAGASWLGIAAALYLGTMATLFGYAAWGSLLQRHPAGAVAPFALLAPCAGVLASALIFGEAFSAIRYAGMALILFGLAIIVLPAAWLRQFRRALS